MRWAAEQVRRLAVGLVLLGSIGMMASMLICFADVIGTNFFDWPVPRERRGTRSIVRTGLRVAGEAALQWWRQRLDAHAASPGDITERDGRLTLRFDDPEGQRLTLVDDGGAGDPPVPWDWSSVRRRRRGRPPPQRGPPSRRRWRGTSAACGGPG